MLFVLGGFVVQVGFFDFEGRVRVVDECGNPLVVLGVVDWGVFGSVLDFVRPVNTGVGRPAFDNLLMFKILVLQSLYNLSDDQVEFQIKDRISFTNFLGLGLGDTVPDAKTIWKFKECLTDAGVIKELFDTFNDLLISEGFEARKGQIVDASIVPAKIQRNSREENQEIKDTGEAPKKWGNMKRRGKDICARWTQKNGKQSFGYKNHVNVDVEHKFVRNYIVTPANRGDNLEFEDLIDTSFNSCADNRDKRVFGDSAYKSNKIDQYLSSNGLISRVNVKANRGKPLSQLQKDINKIKSKTRCRVEHVFGVQTQKAKRLIRVVNIKRAETVIGLNNLAYNITRYATLTT